MGELTHLRGEIARLTIVLLEEFGGPTCNESACEMAVRLLREQKAEVGRLQERDAKTQQLLLEADCRELEAIFTAAAAEREACAKLCDERAEAWHYSVTSLPYNANPVERQERRSKEIEATYLAELIRAGVTPGKKG